MSIYVVPRYCPSFCHGSPKENGMAESEQVAMKEDMFLLPTGAPFVGILGAAATGAAYLE
jgi:hypothetical protein